MVAGAESHTGVDYDIILSLGHIGMETAVHRNFSAHDYRLEIVAFPFGVPVLTRHELAAVFYLDIKWKLCNSCICGLAVVERRCDIGRHSRPGVGLVLLETLIAGIGQKCGKQVAGIDIGRAYDKRHPVVIIHIRRLGALGFTHSYV